MLNPLKHLTARPAGRPAASGPARPAASAKDRKSVV